MRNSHPSWSLSLLAVVLLASCIRLNEPEEYTCHEDSDCEDQEKCLVTLRTPRCVPEDHCWQAADCGSSELCIGGTCTVPECQGGGFDANCAPYTCDRYSYTCNTGCFSQASCAQGYLCSEGACVPEECHAGRQSACEPYLCQGGLCGTSCTDSSQCIGYHECKDQQCVPRLRLDGEPCAASGECASDLCCPTGLQDVYECATECTYRDAGETCQWGAVCRSQNCLDGACTACESADCAEEACKLRECGTVAGVSCGECPAKHYCSAEGTCIDACGDRNCGVVDGISCGECGEREPCMMATGMCVPACVDRECGQDRGVLCGECGDGEWCDTQYQCRTACQSAECGTDHGYSCGECTGLTYCELYQCEPACVGRVCGTDHGVSCGACEAGELCDAGQCVVGECIASEPFCDDQLAYECSADATERTLVEECPLSSFCDDATGTCMPDVCTPGEPYCAGSRFTTCTDDGDGGEVGGTDCSTRSASCHVLGCGTSRTDRIAQTPVNNLYEEKARVGNIYLVSKTVTLTRIEAIIDKGYLNTYVEASFSISQADTLNGTYSTVANIGIKRDGIATDLDIVLTAGKYYAILAYPHDSMDQSVRIERSSFSSGSSIAVSFGSAVSGSFVNLPQFGGGPAIQPTSGHIYHQTLRTLELAP